MFKVRFCKEDYYIIDFDFFLNHFHKDSMRLYNLIRLCARLYNLILFRRALVRTKNFTA